MDLEQQLRESRRYYVCGVIENDPVAPRRFAEVYEADSPRQAEDMARQEVSLMKSEGRYGNLWVAGVYQLNFNVDGQILEPAFLNVDGCAYVDPDRDPRL